MIGVLNRNNMKKIILIVVLMLLICAGAVFTLRFFIHDKDTLQIAVVGAFSGTAKAKGQKMLNGVKLYIDEVNRQGGLNGRTIKLRIFDDHNDRKKAMQIAERIAADKEIFLVLGHLAGDTSKVAGSIYKKYNIPVITASAKLNDITNKNEWYFRTIANHSTQSEFLITYVNKILKFKSGCIIYNHKSAFGLSLMRSFTKRAQELGMNIKKKFPYDPKSKTLHSDLQRIVTQIRSINEPGAIFLATDVSESITLISLLKSSGAYTFIGHDHMAMDTYADKFAKFPMETTQPGYYSDGIYAVSSFIPEIANTKGQLFQQTYVRAYDSKPDWLAACYYDAAFLAVETLKRAEPMPGFIRRSRREIKEILAGMRTPEDGVAGITGFLYFNNQGDASPPPFIGFFNKQKFIPAFSQYVLQPGGQKNDDTFKKVVKGDLVLLGSNLLKEARIVYCGMELNHISHLKLKDSSYNADFYLWFRYKGDFNPQNIIILNARDPIKLGQPLSSVKIKDMTVEAYHIKGTFQNIFDLHDFPFLKLQLKINFRHNTYTRDQLIYAVDPFGLPDNLMKKKLLKIKGAIGWWFVDNMELYQDVLTNKSSLGAPEIFSSKSMAFSRFNLDVQISRKSLPGWLRFFLPVITMIISLFLILFLPFRKIWLSLMIWTSILLTNSILHYNHVKAWRFQYFSILEKSYLTIYLLIGFTVGAIIILNIIQRRKADKTLLTAHLIRLLYLLIVAVAVLLILV